MYILCCTSIRHFYCVSVLTQYKRFSGMEKKEEGEQKGEIQGNSNDIMSCLLILFVFQIIHNKVSLILQTF